MERVNELALPRLGATPLVKTIVSQSLTGRLNLPLMDPAERAQKTDTPSKRMHEA